MTARETGGPAFPSLETYRPTSGMTLRDYFAGQALAGLCAYGIPGEHHTPEATAEDAYAYADAMLAEREK